MSNAKGQRLTVHGVQYLLNKHRTTASRECPSLEHERVTVHRLRHTAAMDLLQAGVDRAVIADMAWARIGRDHTGLSGRNAGNQGAGAVQNLTAWRQTRPLQAR